MPRAMIEDVRSRVGGREFSSYVATAVARQLQRDALDDVIASMEAKHGLVDEQAVAQIAARVEL